MPNDSAVLDWVVLTMGDRPAALAAAIQSLLPGLDAGLVGSVVVISNGAGRLELPKYDGVDLVIAVENTGVPGGRDLGVARTTAPIVGFLDDDAIAPVSVAGRVVEEFSSQPGLGAVSLRLVDADGQTARRHVPRARGADPDRSGEVALFLGGASAVRRRAYEQVGGYFTDLFYGHEEVELCWRLIDGGWEIHYLADVEVFHPRTEIGRHGQGWRLTGRNRVWIARRTLPWPIAVAHVAGWLVVGWWRAPDASCRRSYLAGWWEGWRTTWQHASPRNAISWAGVWRLTRLGRPPVI